LIYSAYASAATFQPHSHAAIGFALDFPKWAIKAIDKIRWAFLWKGRKEVNGDHCLAHVYACRT